MRPVIIELLVNRVLIHSRQTRDPRSVAHSGHAVTRCAGKRDPFASHRIANGLGLACVLWPGVLRQREPELAEATYGQQSNEDTPKSHGYLFSCTCSG